MSARAVREFVAGFKSDPDYDYRIEQHALVVEFINERYAVVERHPKGCVVVHIPSGHALTFEDFRNVFGACNFRILRSDGSIIVAGLNFGNEWLKHSGRRQVETVEELRDER